MRTETATASAADEWRRHFMLPIGGAFGYSTCVIGLYGIGAYIVPITEAFGWTRLQLMSGLMIATLIQAPLAVPIGILIDRYGPRIFGLLGVLLVSGAFGLLSTATGSKVNWYILWGIMGAAGLLTQPVVWTRAVAARFDRSRGLALALTMCGTSMAAGIFPLLGTWLIETQGWRSAFALQAGIWVIIAFPIVFFCFDRAGSRPQTATATTTAKPADHATMKLRDGFRSSIYLRLFISTFFVGTSIMAIVVHFVPILAGSGIKGIQAAGIASLIGVAAIVGKLITGVLLDRFETTFVGGAAFLAPMFSGVLLLVSGDNVVLLSLAALMIGMTLGAEGDFLAYIIAKYFGIQNFGAMLGGLFMAVMMGGAIGPLCAAAIFDHYGTYSPYLWFAIVSMFGSSVAIFSLPRPNAMP